MNKDELRYLHLDDQLWQGIMERKEDIIRIARFGPTTEDDATLVKAILHFTVARVAKSEYDQEQEEEIV